MGLVGTIARVKRDVCSDDETTAFSGNVKVAQDGKGGGLDDHRVDGSL